MDPQQSDLTLDQALAYAEGMDDDFRDGINQVIEVQNHPGYRLILAYVKGQADIASSQLIDADALDSKEISRLQLIARLYKRFCDAPGELIRSQVALEIQQESDAEVYEDS